MYSGTRANSSGKSPGNSFGRMSDRRVFPSLSCLLILFLLAGFAACFAASSAQEGYSACFRQMISRGFQSAHGRTHCCFVYGLRAPRTVQQFRKQEQDNRADNRSCSGMLGSEKFHCPKNWKNHSCRKQLCRSASGIFFSVMNASFPVRAGPSQSCGSVEFDFFRFA